MTLAQCMAEKSLRCHPCGIIGSPPSRGIVSLEALCYKTAWGCWQELLASGEQAWPEPEPEPGQPTGCAARGAERGKGSPGTRKQPFLRQCLPAPLLRASVSLAKEIMWKPTAFLKCVYSRNIFVLLKAFLFHLPGMKVGSFVVVAETCLKGQQLQRNRWVRLEDRKYGE